MTIDKEKLKALAELATQGDWERDGYQVCPVADQNASLGRFGKSTDAAYVAAAQPSVVLALLAEIEQLRESHEQVCTNYNRVSFTSEQRGKHIDQLKAENEVLRKQVADLSPFKNASPQDYRASNKCLACGDYHHGLGNLPCPRCTPVAQSAMAKEASHDHE
ncbi:ead/Ea22-like family protein [Pseudomonas asiatica]|uniref:ead/Ea22-like family protein n=1 Tax=Pseudomonas asiatica TaxID=2219225 RepID=UPI0025A05511|nr:ead/Ea22-like family protein [Pseudomonas asiatica]MDM9589596.1 ead/Ea22-like family protein [Pseudomonas asiatica]WJM51706.1 ead/Ea22-like family protein [Pseudomonas asiatica]